VPVLAKEKRAKLTAVSARSTWRRTRVSREKRARADRGQRAEHLPAQSQAVTLQRLARRRAPFARTRPKVAAQRIRVRARARGLQLSVSVRRGARAVRARARGTLHGPSMSAKAGPRAAPGGLRRRAAH
jgi:hypothetical protein